MAEAMFPASAVRHSALMLIGMCDLAMEQHVLHAEVAAESVEYVLDRFGLVLPNTQPVSVLTAVSREVQRQDAIHPAGYPATRDGLRFALATLADELDEALAAWREERRTPGWPQTAEELLQVAGVAVRALRSIHREANQPREETPASC